MKGLPAMVGENDSFVPAEFNREALDILPDAIFIADAGGRITQVNRAVEELLGWRPEEIIGAPVEILVPPRFTAHMGHRANYMKTPSRRPMGQGPHLAALHRDGHEVPVDIALSPLSIGGQHHVLASMRRLDLQRFGDERLHLLSVAVNAAASGVVITNQDGIIVWANPAACAMTGYHRDELVGGRPNMLKSGRHEPAFYADLWATVRRGEIWKGAIINRRKDGAEYHEQQTIAPVVGTDGAITHFIAIKEDVTERVRAENALRETRDELSIRMTEVESLTERLREQAIRDPLSNLFNRRYLDETLPREIARAEREKSRLTLIVIDIDHFKRVNDVHGHLVGDRVIVRLGELMLNHSRRGDLACRYGGEEFVLVLLNAELNNGIRHAEGLRRDFEAAGLHAPNGQPLGQTLSAGVAEWHPGESPTQLFDRADAALYRAKASGRNRVDPQQPSGPAAAT